MNIALDEARQALEAGEFPVGCVLVHKNLVAAGVRRRNSAAGQVNELDHAEIIALRDLAAKQPDINRQEIVAFSTMEPCLMCYAAMLISGIRSFVYAYEDVMGGGTSLDLSSLSPLYREMKVSVVPFVLREASLGIFKDYFLNPANVYLRGSLLAEYTLAQSSKAQGVRRKA